MKNSNSNDDTGSKPMLRAFAITRFSRPRGETSSDSPWSSTKSSGNRSRIDRNERIDVP